MLPNKEKYNQLQCLPAAQIQYNCILIETPYTVAYKLFISIAMPGTRLTAQMW